MLGVDARLKRHRRWHRCRSGRRVVPSSSVRSRSRLARDARSVDRRWLDSRRGNGGGRNRRARLIREDIGRREIHRDRLTVRGHALIRHRLWLPAWRNGPALDHCRRERLSLPVRHSLRRGSNRLRRRRRISSEHRGRRRACDQYKRDQPRGLRTSIVLSASLPHGCSLQAASCRRSPSGVTPVSVPDRCSLTRGQSGSALALPSPVNDIGIARGRYRIDRRDQSSLVVTCGPG